MEKMVFMNGCYLLSVDGTGYFSSNKVHCDHCSVKTNSKTGEVTYDHQMLGAGKRFFDKLRTVHPHLRLIVVEDALSSSGHFGS